ncbi:MAG: ATP phosphoribosyltransferase [Flavobacteriales bacterium]|nr:ATP phosphoribosyltransferase [Flavobacteriales bacterium]
MSKLKIAIQKSGRLNEDSLKLLKSCGIKVENSRDQLKVSVPNFPLEILYLRNSDIPQYLEDGVVDIAIVGENLLIEQEKEVDVIQKLGFSKCRVSLAVPKETATENVSFFEGKRIATSYPNTINKFLRANNVNAEIHKISGSVEIAPNIGLADGICDIVSSGSTLFKNGLKEAEVILESEAVLVSSRNISTDKKVLLDKLSFRIEAVLRAKNSKYVLLNLPNDRIEAVSAILPVLKSPTILPLAQEGWSSLHSVIDEDQFWEVIDELKEAGAEGILIVPIDKMVI